MASSAITAHALPNQVKYYETTTKTIRTNVFTKKQNCIIHTHCHVTWISNPCGSPSYVFKGGFRAPNDWSVDTPLVTDTNGKPLTFGRTAVTFSPEPCGGSCEVQLLHPAPAGQHWYQFRSNPLPMSCGPIGTSGDLDFDVDFRCTFGPTGLRPTDIVAAWFSDDTDDRYGWVVQDFYAESGVTTNVPGITRGSMLALGSLLVVLGGSYLLYRRKESRT
jgi:hypothetical protein